MSLVSEFWCLDLFAGLLDHYRVLDKFSENGIRSCQSFSSVRTMFNPLKIIHYLLNTENSFTAVLVYVDDLLVTGNDLPEIESIKSLLHQKFTIKDLGDLKYFLGIEVLELIKAFS